jgi:hypothetical protein
VKRHCKCSSFYNRTKPTCFCDYCKRNGHTEDRHFKKQRDQGITPTTESRPTANVSLLCYNSCLLTTCGAENVNMNTFIADLGASAHMIHSKSLLSDFTEEEGEVNIGDNTEVKSLGTGRFKGYHVNNKGEKVDDTINRVVLDPDLWVNLLSITKATSNKDC